jgi:hypothetical protein
MLMVARCMEMWGFYMAGQWLAKVKCRVVLCTHAVTCHIILSSVNKLGSPQK